MSSGRSYSEGRAGASLNICRAGRTGSPLRTTCVLARNSFSSQSKSNSMRIVACLSHCPEGTEHEKYHACLFRQHLYLFDAARNKIRCRAHFDETILVRPERPCLSKLPCFASTDKIRHDISLTLNLHILSGTPQLPYCDVATIRVRYH